jgi:hypothetical protein
MFDEETKKRREAKREREGGTERRNKMRHSQQGNLISLLQFFQSREI